MTDTIHVAAAVIINSDKETLLSLRLPDVHQGGKWEFPGGKFEDDETTEQALYRELLEEIGIAIESTCPFLSLCHNYPEKTVYLHVLEVLEFSGEPKGLEGQEVRWVSAEAIRDLTFPDANYPILQKLLERLSD